MKPDVLADADGIDLTITARFIQEAESVFVQMPSESLRVKHIHGVTLEVKALADAYLAREADDAKPVDMQAEVMRWHDLVFPDRRPLQVAKKLLEEASECHIAAKELDAEKTAREAADCAIIAYVLANMGGFDLHQLMREKLAILINRADQQAERDRERGIED